VLKQRTQVINYRWTVLDAAAAQIAVLLDVWATPYRIRPRDLDKGRRGIKLGLPLLDSEGFKASDISGGFNTGELVSFSLGLTADPPSVARFFREGYEWVDVPTEIDISGMKIKEVLEACYEHDAVRFAHCDPKIVYSTYAASAAARWPEMMPISPLRVPGFALNPYNYPWGDLAMLHLEYWDNTDLRAALINQYANFDQPKLSQTGWLDALKGLGVFALALLGDDPWTGVWGDLWPWMLPAQEGEYKLKKVLARTALTGVPIQALPTSIAAGGKSKSDSRTVTVVSMPPPRIELDGFGRQTIHPLRDPVGLLPGPFARRPRASKLRFRITIPVPALTTTIEIYRGDSLYYRETHQLGEFLIPGMHIWSWDCYDKDGVFDTMALKGGDLSARLTVTDLKGRTSVTAMPLACGPGSVRWADVRIDSDEQQIDVTTFLHFLAPSEIKLFDLELPVDNLASGLDTAMSWLSDKASPSGGAAMMGMLPSLLDAWPADAGTGFDDLLEELRATFRTEGQGSDPGSAASAAVNKYMGLLPQMLNTGDIDVGSELGRIMSGSDLDQVLFERSRIAIINGIKRHWSRSVTIEGEPWTLTTNCKERAVDAQRNYLASDGGWFGAARKKDGDRAFNAATFGEGLPIFSVWTSRHDCEPADVDRGWLTDEDAKRAEVGAHELGHSVLRERKDFVFSLLHKGTSTAGQKRKPDSPFHLEEDASGNVNWEIDVMYYYHNDSDPPPETWQERTMAAEEDACVLINMAKITFG